VIAQSKAKYFHADVSHRIADAIDALLLRKSQPETAADRALIRQRIFDFAERVARHSQVRMQKPKHFAMRDRRAGIHLQPAAALRRDNQFGQRLRD
jgi:hypothetical protein